jgi:L-ascorbate metabolism protein UlaG (beta-lactamase superfamily)
MAPRFWERFSADVKRTVPAANHHPKFEEWTTNGIHAAWIGHSTVLIDIEGFTTVIDTVFSNRIGINLGPVTLGLKRWVQPAAELRDIPRPDLILLSHAHMNHFDLPSLRSLRNKETTVISAANTTDLLNPSRYSIVQELRWNESKRVGPATIHAFEVNHWGAWMQHDTNRGYNGYVIEVAGRRVLFGGDTAWTETFRPLRSLGHIDLAIMPVGAYDPWIRAHCDPEQALRMADDAGADHILPIHHKTFELSREGLNEPIERLLAASGSNTDRILIREIGQEFHIN